MPDSVSWAESGDVVSPPTGKIAVGFVDSERPPAPFFNWILRKLARWTSGARTINLPGPAWSPATVAGATPPKRGSLIWTFQGGPNAGELECVLPLQEGDRLTDMSFRYDRNGVGSLTFYVFSNVFPDETLSGGDIVVSQTISSGTGLATHTFSAINYTLGAGETIVAAAQSDTTTTGAFVGAEFTFDHPAP